MTERSLPLAAAILAAALFGFPVAHAQSSSAETASQSAKPSPYQGVSKPPASDVITTSEDAPEAPSSTQAPKLQSSGTVHGADQAAPLQARNASAATSISPAT